MADFDPYISKTLNRFWWNLNIRTMPLYKIWFRSDDVGGLGDYPVCHCKVSLSFFLFGIFVTRILGTSGPILTIYTPAERAFWAFCWHHSPFSSLTCKILNLEYYRNYYTDSNQILHSNKDHQMLFMGCPNSRKANQMVDGQHFEKSKNGPYLRNSVTNRHKISLGTFNFELLTVQDGGRPPSW